MALLTHCADCGADISHRRGPAVRCEPCATDHRREKQREYNSRHRAAHPGYHAEYQRKLRAMCRPARRCPPRNDSSAVTVAAG